MADHDERCVGRRDIGEQKIEERLLAVAVERGGRLVGDDEFGRADQRARGGNALLLAHAQVRGGAAIDKGGLDAEALQEPRRRGVAPPSASARFRRPAEKLSGSTTLSITEP